MAPKPIEDIDFPALGDALLELLLALWTFVCDLCLALWDHVSQAFWAVWTYPPFETFRNELAAALIGLMDYAAAHPITSAVLAILALVVLPRVLYALEMCILRCLGFRRRGVLRGSYAANYQSTAYGGNVPSSSTFGRYQSRGVKGGHRTPRGPASSSWH